MKSEVKILTFLVLLALALFFVTNEYWGGYLSTSEQGLADEIASPQENLQQWSLSKEAPFKYRMLFPAIIKGSWQLLPYSLQNSSMFFIVYKTWSLLFFLTSVISFFTLLRAAGFNSLWSFLGGILFLLSPAVLLAYTLPVHTREDTLAYTILCTGLICLFRRKIGLFVLITLLGVLCRETLLILPFVFLFFSSYRNFWVRAVLSGLPVCLWLSLRLFIDSGTYDPWVGLKWNLNNLEQVAGFLFISFGFLWPLFFYGMFYSRHTFRRDIDNPLHFIYRSSLAVFLLIIATTFIGGIYNEIRLLFLMFPWVITMALHVLYAHHGLLLQFFRNKRYFYFFLGNIVVFGIAYAILLNNYQKLLEPSIYDIRFDVWITVTLVYTLCTVLLIPFYWRIFQLNLPPVNKFANHG